MGCYYTLCHNTYAYSLLFYKVYIKRENAHNWDFGLEKEQILETYYAQLQKSWNFMEDVFRIYKKYSAEKDHQVGHKLGVRARTPGLLLPGGSPLVFSLTSIFLLIPKMTSVKFQDFRNCAEYVSNICSFSREF